MIVFNGVANVQTKLLENAHVTNERKPKRQEGLDDGHSQSESHSASPSDEDSQHVSDSSASLIEEITAQAPNQSTAREDSKKASPGLVKKSNSSANQQETGDSEENGDILAIKEILNRLWDQFRRQNPNHTALPRLVKAGKLLRSIGDRLNNQQNEKGKWLGIIRIEWLLGATLAVLIPMTAIIVGVLANSRSSNERAPDSAGAERALNRRIGDDIDKLTLIVEKYQDSFEASQKALANRVDEIEKKGDVIQKSQDDPSKKKPDQVLDAINSILQRLAGIEKNLAGKKNIEPKAGDNEAPKKPKDDQVLLAVNSLANQLRDFETKLLAAVGAQSKNKDTPPKKDDPVFLAVNLLATQLRDLETKLLAVVGAQTKNKDASSKKDDPVFSAVNSLATQLKDIETKLTAVVAAQSKNKEEPPKKVEDPVLNALKSINERLTALEKQMSFGNSDAIQDTWLVALDTARMSAKMYLNAYIDTLRRFARKDSSFRLGFAVAQQGELTEVVKLTDTELKYGAVGDPRPNSSETPHRFGLRLKNNLFDPARPRQRVILVATTDCSPLTSDDAGWKEISEVHVILVARKKLDQEEKTRLVNWQAFCLERNGSVTLIDLAEPEKQVNQLSFILKRICRP